MSAVRNEERMGLITRPPVTRRLQNRSATGWQKNHPQGETWLTSAISNGQRTTSSLSTASEESGKNWK